MRLTLKVGSSGLFLASALLWTAPEHLEDESKSQLGDVYSYGIILSEIITRDYPYSDSLLSVEGKFCMKQF